MTGSDLPDDWWPEWLHDFATDDPLAAEHGVLVAEIARTADEYVSYRHLFSALVPPERLEAVLHHPGGIGHDVSSSGPHPAEFRGSWDYTPLFWVDSGGLLQDGLEPLVVSWESANRSVLWPDQGFLMTYGLIPRTVQTPGNGVNVHWDDPSVPRADVIVARIVSSYDFPNHSGAHVAIAREYLQDYATIRGQALVQVYYVQRSGPLTPKVEAALGGERHVDFRVPGRLIDVRLSETNDRGDLQVLAQVWGVRPLLGPADAPVSGGRWEYGDLIWPGVAEPITKALARRLNLVLVYVRDSVLGQYEGRPEFSIHPETGSVSYRPQWSVSPARRVGRDLIAVDLKKLYEGNQPGTVRHWHSYAVTPPLNPPALRGALNVGSRARRIVYGLTDLGGYLADLAAPILGRPLAGANFVGLDRADLDYRGWWTADHVEPVTRHVPLGLDKSGFLARCNVLYILAAEGLNEKLLRQTLLALGVATDDLKDFRSLKLLNLLVRITDLANRSGLHPRIDAPALLARLIDEPASNPLEVFFALNELRQLADHRVGARGQERFVWAIQVFGLDQAGYAAGWGTALDSIYDTVGETIESIAQTLARAGEAD